MRTPPLAACAAALFIFAITARADSVPDWVKAASQGTPPDYDRSAPFVVLFEERTTSIKENGRAETRWRYAIRILTKEGRAAARREIHYDSQIRVSELRGWHIRSDQKVFELESDRVTEESPFDDLYSDIKSKVMRFSEVEIGSVVAFEWTQKEKPLVNQDLHFFQTRSPSLLSRYKLIVPRGWGVEWRVFNHPAIKPVVEGNVHTWQLERLPQIKDEPWMADAASLSPWLAISWYPPRGEAQRSSISTWQDVSRWAGDLMRRPPKEKGIIEAKAAELTSGLRSNIEKARAVSRWVQKNVRYASIQLSAIGGYRPNLPDSVLTKGYGDCKDKSALLQAMLRAVGIESFLMLVYSGDYSRVRSEFPSPLQFNHAIIAIALDAAFPSTVDAQGLGRLLLFDPTDDQTPMGDLPFYLQGGYGLVVKDGSGALVKLPDQSEEANTLRREIDVEIGSGGDISARVREAYSGQMASAARRRMARLSVEELTREITARASRDVPGAVIEDLKINRDAEIEEPLRIDYEMKASGFANRMNRLLVIRPLLLRAQQFPQFTQTDRSSPVRFEMKSIQEDIIRIHLPEGFRIDEVPLATEIKNSFGDLVLSYRLEASQVIVRRRLAIKEQSVPALNYAEVKKLFDAAQSASQANIVLVSQ